MRKPRTAAVLIALVLAAGCALFAACGGANSPDATAEPEETPTASTTESGISIPPKPVGTPGDRDPAPLGTPDPEVTFEIGTLNHPDLALSSPTTAAFGPDGRLYVGQLDGTITAMALDGQTVTGVETIAGADVLLDVLGIAFNPNDPPEPVTLYVTHTQLFAEDGDPFSGTVSKLTGPDWARSDVITGLPVSNQEHGTNGLAFDGHGRMFINQGGTTNAGVPGERHSRAETPLSSAVLVADIGDAAFDGAVTYAPSGAPSRQTDQASGDVRVYAAGFRNPYDIVVHSNGHIYVTDNGPNAPDGARSESCTADGPDPWSPDELNLLIEGHYYGHANRNRGRDDARQCTYRMPDDTSGESTPPIATLGYSVSANGMAEYTSDAFGGRMRGDLLYVEWVKNRVWRVQLAPDGTAVDAISQLVPEEFDQPIDVTVGPDGTIYLVEIRGDRITYLRPAAAF